MLQCVSVTGLQFLNNEGSALYSIESKANHSCIPNAQAAFPHSNHNLHLVALRDIQCGKFDLFQFKAICSRQSYAFCSIDSMKQVKRFAFHIWTIACCHEVVIHGRKSCAKTTCSHAHVKSVRSKKVIQMSQATKKMSKTMMITTWTRIKTIRLILNLSKELNKIV